MNKTGYFICCTVVGVKRLGEIRQYDQSPTYNVHVVRLGSITPISLPLVPGEWENVLYTAQMIPSSSGSSLVLYHTITININMGLWQ